MCEFNIKITIAQRLKFAIVSAKSKIYSPSRGYFIMHQRHNFLPSLGLILLKLKRASNRPVYFRDLCAAYSAIFLPYHISTHVCKFVKGKQGSRKSLPKMKVHTIKYLKTAKICSVVIFVVSNREGKIVILLLLAAILNLFHVREAVTSE